MARNKSSGTNRADSDAATIFDVASLAGVSIKTVSRVVNQEPNVREKTRDKVMAAVQALRYQPNTAARGLSGKRSYVIGLIYENALEFSYMKNVLDGALAVCEAQGYTLLLRPVTLPSEGLAERVRAFALQARLDGVLLPAPMGDIEGVVATLAELAIPFATITPKTPHPDSISVFSDDARASQSLTSYLIDQGHERIAFIKGHPDHRASDERFRGYRAALKERKLAYTAKLVRQGYFTFLSGREAAAKLLGLSPPPTAIIASNDDMAAGVAFEARERGCMIPDDLSVVGFDDTPVASQIWPPLTTVRQPIAGMAEAAAAQLIRRLRGEALDPPAQPFECEVVIRQSSAPPA